MRKHRNTHGVEGLHLYNTESPVWIGAGYVARHIPGPSDLDKWLKCFMVFKFTLFLLGGTSISALEARESGGDGLMITFPHSSEHLVVAHEVIHNGFWARLSSLTQETRPACWDEKCRGAT